jgi:hypothetical protein
MCGTPTFNGTPCCGALLHQQNHSFSSSCATSTVAQPQFCTRYFPALKSLPRPALKCQHPEILDLFLLKSHQSVVECSTRRLRRNFDSLVAGWTDCWAEFLDQLVLQLEGGSFAISDQAIQLLMGPGQADGSC